MLTQEQLAKLTEENPKGIVHLIGKGGRWECVFRAPTRSTEFKPYKARLHDASKVADAAEILARQIVVYPSKEAFAALLEDFPGIPEALTGNDEFQAMVGVSTEADQK
jgi:hypothetical protein